MLPSEIMRLLDSGTGIDPTVSAHLGSTVGEYTQLQETIRSKRLALDTAQAAFNHRYKILVPVEVPGKPNKSKGPVILIGGWLAGILLVLVYAVIAELRTGVWSSGGRFTRCSSPFWPNCSSRPVHASEDEIGAATRGSLVAARTNGAGRTSSGLLPWRSS